MSTPSWSETAAVLAAWGQAVSAAPDRDAAVRRAAAANAWFPPRFVDEALRGLTDGLLATDALSAWLDAYAGPAGRPLTVALVPAGNVPAVGFHDLFCVLAAGHRAQVRCSSKDAVLLPWLVDRLADVSPEWAARVVFTERLSGFDAVIATGSDNAGRYFDRYFGRYPHLIRRNRQSVAVLDGTETPADWAALGRDVFTHFGLGCRSVSKLFLPEGLPAEHALDAWTAEWREFLLGHTQYRHNYDYRRTLLLLNGVAHLASDYLMLVEDGALASPLATLHWERYGDTADLESRLAGLGDAVQIVVGGGAGRVRCGEAKRAGPAVYADGRETMAFLLGL